MKSIFSVLLLSGIFSFSSLAQDKPLSPPKNVTGEIENVMIEVNYNAPSVRDRVIWGELVPYDKVWRTGANEATTVKFANDVMIDGQQVEAGKYALFTIPGEEEWTVILNSDYKQWGAYKYDESKDILRVSVKPQTVEHQEQMEIDVTEVAIAIEWEELRIAIPVSAG